VGLGNADAALEQFHFNLRLSPLDPRIYSAQTGLAFTHFFAGRNEEASLWATTAVGQQPSFLGTRFILAASHAMTGRVEEARESCVRLMQLNPALRVSGIKTRGPFRRTEDVERLMQAFRIAGMPE
jgi:hypothetical protein